MEDSKKEKEQRLFVRLAEIGNSTFAGFIPNQYLTAIVEKYWEEIQENINETADQNNWNTEDMGMSIGRILCEKLDVEV